MRKKRSGLYVNYRRILDLAHILRANTDDRLNFRCIGLERQGGLSKCQSG
jgi:hypothetical protein